MTVGAERLSVDPCLRYGVDGLIAVEAEHLGDDSRGRDFDEHDVIQANSVERVEERETSLDFVGHDHSLKEILHGESLSLTREMISNSQDGSKVIGRVPPWAGGGRSECI